VGIPRRVSEEIPEEPCKEILARISCLSPFRYRSNHYSVATQHGFRTDAASVEVSPHQPVAEVEPRKPLTTGASCLSNPQENSPQMSVSP